MRKHVDTSPCLGFLRLSLPRLHAFDRLLTVADHKTSVGEHSAAPRKAEYHGSLLCRYGPIPCSIDERLQAANGLLVETGMGVSGGYQAARRGPSMCPGGEDVALDLVMPLLEKVAAKDSRGKPCVGRAGMGGAGHYVKMIHNGIEHGMMSALAGRFSGPLIAAFMKVLSRILSLKTERYERCVVHLDDFPILEMLTLIGNRGLADHEPLPWDDL